MKVTFFANPSSIHVRRWLDLTRLANIQTEGWSADEIPPHDIISWKTATRYGGVLRYALSGFKMRLRRGEATIIHAHGASGYGLMAWLSGRPYIVTIYGSEVYSAGERGTIYRWLLRAILRRAVRVTCTTPAMRDHVILRFGVEPGRIHMFSMGISSRDFYQSEEERAQERRRLELDNALVITSNRRIRVQYRIELLLRAFVVLQASDERYRMILLEGDSNAAYARFIEQVIDENALTKKVILVRGFRAPHEVRRYLLASDVVVSIPTSDQMSAAILEALACGATVVGSPIPAYEELFREGLALRGSLDSPEALAASLATAAASRPSTRGAMEKTKTWLHNYHSDEAVVREVVTLYSQSAQQ